MSFVYWLSTKDVLYQKPGLDLKVIELAEKELGVIFADEYKEYLLTYGAAFANGHEFTGIVNNVSPMDVVKVTKDYRLINHKVPNDCYVVEDWHMDSVIIWQDSSGKVYETIGKEEPRLVANSIVEYLESLDQ